MNTLSYTATASITPPRPLVPGTVRRNLNPYGEGWKVSKQSTSTKQQPRPPPTPFGGTLLPSLPPSLDTSWSSRGYLVATSCFSRGHLPDCSYALSHIESVLVARPEPFSKWLSCRNLVLLSRGHLLVLCHGHQMVISRTALNPLSYSARSTFFQLRK